MFKYFIYKIYFLCFVVLCCALCVPLCSLSKAEKASLSTTTTSSTENEVQLFKEDKIKNVETYNCEPPQLEEIAVSDVKTYFFISAGDFMTALVRGKICDKKPTKKGDLLAKYIKITEAEQWWENAVKDTNSDEWKTQLASEINGDGKDTFETGGFCVVVNKDKIYFISVNIIEKNGLENLQTYEGLNLKFVENKINDEKKPAQLNKVTWTTQTTQLKDNTKFIKDFKEKLSDTKNIDCFAFIMTNNNKIGLVIKGSSRTNNEKTVFGVLNLEAAETTPTLSFVNTFEDCPSSFFPWDEKLIMIPTDCSGGSGKVRRSTEMTEWADGVGPFSRLWNILKDKGDFSSIVIDDDNKKKRVLLFTQKKEEDKVSGGKNKIHLWMSDGNRVKYVGIISDDVMKDFPIRLLFTHKKLFSLHQKEKDGGIKSFTLTRLQTHLETIKLTLDAWGKADNIISTLCTNAANKNVPCLTKFPTDGLVGFLYNGNNESGQWIDEYFGVNAFVKPTQQEKEKVEKVQNGFKFNGKGVGAQWPVKKTEEEDQPYNFTDPGFTLMTTVKIENYAEEKSLPNSVLGVVLDTDLKSVKLWCNTEKKWAVSVEKATDLKENGEECVQGKTYNVALVLEETGHLKIYVDGEQLTGLTNKIKKINKNEIIKHFYFGVDSEGTDGTTDVSHVTITNVMLYNKPFNEEEMKKLKPKQDSSSLQSLQHDKTDVKDNNGEGSSTKLENDLKETDELTNTLTQQTNSETNEHVVQSSTLQRESAVSVCVNLWNVLYLLIVCCGGCKVCCC